MIAVLATVPIFLISYRQPWIWSVISACWLCFGAVAAIRAVRLDCPSEIDWISLSLLAFPLAGVIQYVTGWTANPAATASESIHWVALAALFVGARSILSSTCQRERFLNILFYLGTTVAVLTLLRLGPFPNRNHFAAFIELVFPLAMLRALDRDWRGILAAGVMIVSVVAGGSRAGTALIVAEAGFLAMIRRPTLMPAFLVPLFARDFGHREDLYRSTFAMIRERPFAGHGLGSFETVYPAFALFDNGLIVDHAHNDWLEWAAEAGVIPVALLLTVAIWSFSAARRHLWAIGAPAVFLHALVDYPLHKPAVAACTFVMLAALSASYSLKRCDIL